MGELEGRSCRGLAQEGDAALFGLVVLDGEVNRARAAVDDDEQVALASLAVAGLQLGQVLDVDVHEAEVVGAEGALAFGGLVGGGLRPAVSPLALRMCQMLSPLRCGKTCVTTKVRLSSGKLVARRRV